MGDGVAENLTIKYQQISETIQEINNVVARIDERLDIFIEKIGTLELKIDNHIENCPIKCAFTDVSSRVRVLELGKETITEVKSHITDLRKQIEEIKIAAKEINILSTNSSQKWKTAGQFVFQVLAPLVYIIIGAIIFHFLNLRAPSVSP